eukprot:13462197-Ditylum_brightwellii.AAC.1
MMTSDGDLFAANEGGWLEHFTACRGNQFEQDKREQKKHDYSEAKEKKPKTLLPSMTTPVSRKPKNPSALEQQGTTWCEESEQEEQRECVPKRSSENKETQSKKVQGNLGDP